MKVDNEKVKKESDTFRSENATLKTYSMHLDRCNNFLKAQNPVLRPEAVTLEAEPPQPAVKKEPGCE